MRANRAQEDVKEAKKRIMMDGASAAEQAQMKELEEFQEKMKEAGSAAPKSVYVDFTAANTFK